MKKQKKGYVSRKRLYVLHKGEPVVYLRHEDCASKFYVRAVDITMSKKEMAKIRKLMREALYGRFEVEKKPEKVWSVS